MPAIITVYGGVNEIGEKRKRILATKRHKRRKKMERVTTN